MEFLRFEPRLILGFLAVMWSDPVDYQNALGGGQCQCRGRTVSVRGLVAAPGCRPG